MRTIGALATTTILFLLFLTAVPAYPQDREESRPDARPSQQQEGKEKDKAAKPDEGKRGQDQPAARQEERKDEVQQNQQNDRRGQPEASRPPRPAQQMERGHSQRPIQAQRGKRIPDPKFRASFGRQHTFRVQRAQIVDSPQPTIVYGGYSFLLVDPWPSVWAFDDVVFIDFVDDEYFLFDPLYPGIRVALVVIE